MAAARIALVVGIIAVDADGNRCAIAAKLNGAARSPQILVVVFQTRCEVVTKAAA